MKDNGKIITCMGRGHINGKTGVDMWESIRRTRSMAMGYTLGQMGGSIVVIG